MHQIGIGVLDRMIPPTSVYSTEGAVTLAVTMAKVIDYSTTEDLAQEVLVHLVRLACTNVPSGQSLHWSHT